MAAKIIDGQETAKKIRIEISKRVEKLKGRNMEPGLGVILVGDDPASTSYVTAKERACADVGIYSSDNRLSASTSQEDLLALVHQMNLDPRINGILVQLPLPKHINESQVLRSVVPEKDVDGFHPVNIGKMMLGEPCFLPCTPHGIVQLLVHNGVKIPGSHVVVVGRSNIVGKPIANMLVQKNNHANATVTMCHTGTKHVEHYTRQADILIVAAGRPNTITADMVKEGVVVIDVGVNRVPDAKKKSGFRLVGDVDFDGLKDKASLITPVPGGVGPMTITMLLHNTVESAERSILNC